jgi:hypothetical protein
MKLALWLAGLAATLLCVAVHKHISNCEDTCVPLKHGHQRLP